MQAPFLTKTFDETMSLLLEARDYMATQERDDRAGLDSDAAMRVSCEAMRVTARLTQVMAWVMAQRAVERGEMTTVQSLSAQHSLGDEITCLEDRYHDEPGIPASLRSLMERSLNLYERVGRLEGMLGQSLRKGA